MSSEMRPARVSVKATQHSRGADVHRQADHSADRPPKVMALPGLGVRLLCILCVFIFCLRVASLATSIVQRACKAETGAVFIHGRQLEEVAAQVHSEPPEAARWRHLGLTYADVYFQ